LLRHRLGAEEAAIANPAHRPEKSIRTADTYSTAAERHGSLGATHRLKSLAALTKSQLLKLASTLHSKGKDATQRARLGGSRCTDR
jgi:hypothetical protein